MVIVVLASAAASSQLGAILPWPHHVRASRSVDEFKRDLESFPDAVAGIDPRLVSASALSEIIAALQVTRQPFFVITSTRSGCVSAIILLLRAGASEVILCESDDWNAARHVLLSRIPSTSPETKLLRRISASLEVMPVDITMAVIRVFVARTPKGSVAKQLAAELGMTRRTIDRWMRRAGLGSCARVLNAARMARLLPDLRPRTKAVCRIAAAGGYVTAETLKRQCFCVTGLSLGDLEMLDSEDEIIEHMAARLTSAVLAFDTSPTQCA